MIISTFRITKEKKLYEKNDFKTIMAQRREQLERKLPTFKTLIYPKFDYDSIIAICEPQHALEKLAMESLEILIKSVPVLIIQA